MWRREVNGLLRHTTPDGPATSVALKHFWAKMKRSHDSDTPILELLTHNVGTISLWLDAWHTLKHPPSTATCRNLNSGTVDLNWGWSLRSNLHHSKANARVSRSSTRPEVETKFTSFGLSLILCFLSSSFYPYSVCVSLCLFYVLLFLSGSSLSSPFILLPLNFLSSSSLHHLFPSCDFFASFPLLFSYFHHISSSPLFSSCLSTCSRPPSLPTDSPPSLSRLITSLLLASDKQLQFSPAGYITRVMSAALDCHPLDWQSQLPLPASLLLFLCACVSVQHLSVYFNARHRRRSQPLSINLT